MSEIPAGGRDWVGRDKAGKRAKDACCSGSQQDPSRASGQQSRLWSRQIWAPGKPGENFINVLKLLFLTITEAGIRFLGGRM